MKHRANLLNRILLIVGVIPAAWLGMMIVHETGHVLGGIVSGGEVQRVVWHPLAISRTDVAPNPQPMLVVWTGPILGVVLPLLLYAGAAMSRVRFAFLFAFFAGFCLIANGLYIGIGAIDPVGDAHDMIRLGSPRWLLAAFGVPCVVIGLYMWHRVSPEFGFGDAPNQVHSRISWSVVAVSVLITAIAFVFGDHGS